MKRIFKTRAGESCRPVNPILHQIRVKMQLACFFNVLEWWLLIERNQSQWPNSRVLLAFASRLARQPLSTKIPSLPPVAAAAPLSFGLFWLPSPCNCPTFVSFSTCYMQKCGTSDWLKWEKAHEERFVAREEFWSMALLG